MSKRKTFPVTLIFDRIEWIKGEVSHSYGYRKGEKLPDDVIHFSHGSATSYENEAELNVVFTTDEGGEIDIPILDIIKRETNRQRVSQKLVDTLEELFDGRTFEGKCFDNGRGECDLDYFNHPDLIEKVEDKIIYWVYKGKIKKA